MPRLTAWKILRSGTTGPLRDVTPMAEREGLDPRDRALLRRLVGTEVRRRGSLRAIASHFTRGKPSPDILAHVRLGLAQLLYLDQVPDHAALSETVRAVSDSLGLSKSRYVNGVLRTAQRFLREGTSGDPTRDVYGRDWHFEFPVFRDPEQHYYLWVEDALSIPSALFKRWDKRYGRETALGLAQAAQESPGVSLRAVSVTADALRDELRGMPAVDEDAPALDPLPGDHPACLRLPSSAIGAVMRSAAFLEGRCTVQGETALRAAELVGAKAGEHVLDLCCAPGGKSAVLAGSGARVTALDSSARRQASAPEGLARLGVGDRVALGVSNGTAALAADARFDAVLLDAPCSNTGVIGARANARWRFGPMSQAELVALQRRLLAEAAARVAPGGRLVYSTCSLEPEENGQTVRAFLESEPGWNVTGQQEALPAAPGTPGPIDGGFAVRLERG